MLSCILIAGSLWIEQTPDSGYYLNINTFTGIGRTEESADIHFTKDGIASYPVTLPEQLQDASIPEILAACEAVAREQ
tara:strand:+ start:482 stop:715 length:234 start_codon:yes stop_codon:yes gene_type:complete